MTACPPVVLEELIEAGHERLEDLVGGRSLGETLVHVAVADLAVVAHDLDEQPLLRAEVVEESADTPAWRAT